MASVPVCVQLAFYTCFDIVCVGGFFSRGVNAMLLDACFGCTDVNLTTSRNLDTPHLSLRELFCGQSWM